jgi:hypothetical protein
VDARRQPAPRNCGGIRLRGVSFRGLDRKRSGHSRRHGLYGVQGSLHESVAHLHSLDSTAATGVALRAFPGGAAGAAES